MIALKAQYNLTHDITDAELDSYASKEDDLVMAKLLEKLQPCPGANAELRRLAAKNAHRLAVVSSSALRRVLASLETAGQAGYFAPGDVFSAASSLPVPASKPHPAVYLHALRTMGRSAEQCVAVEDSPSGATAACGAGIKTVGYTGAYAPEERDGVARVLMEIGCQCVMDDWKDFQECLDMVQGTGHHVAVDDTAY